MENQEVDRLYHEGAEICRLVSFPEPEAPQQALSTTSNQTGPFLPLMLGTYNATTLAYETVKDFAEGLVHGYQRLARDRFIICYLQAAPIAYAVWARQEDAARQGLEHVLSVDDDFDELRLDHYLRNMMRCLDECFFFGNLTRVQEGYEAPWVGLSTGYGYRMRRQVGTLFGVTQFSETPRSEPWSKIKIWTLQETSTSVEPVPWPVIVSTLVHEMTHAYLATFICRGEKCHNNHLNTFGRSGHGNTFVKIHALILQQIRSWHPVLADMDSTFSLEGGCVDGDACFHEETMYQEAKDRGELRGLVSLRADSPRQLLRLVRGEVNGRTVTTVLFRRRGSPIPHPDAWKLKYAAEMKSGGDEILSLSQSG